MTGIGVIERGNPFSEVPQFRARLAADPKFRLLYGLETKVIRQGDLASGATTLYTCPVKKRARLAGGWLYVHNNTAATNITADFHHVPSGGAAGVTNKVLATQTFNAGTTTLLFDRKLSHILMAGDALVINPGAQGLNVYGQLLEERAAICAFIGGFDGNVSTGNDTIITVPAMRSLALDAIYVFNSTGGAIDLSMHARARSAGSVAAAAAANRILFQTVNAGAAYQLSTELLPTLGEGGIISASGSGAGLSVWTDGVLY